MRRLLAIALGGMIVLLFVAATAVRYDLIDPPPNPEILPAPLGPPGWKVTRRYSVSRVLIVEGECADRDSASEIAKSIVRTSREAYDEVLVYVRAPGEPLHARRVQWTKPGGFRLLDF